MAAHTCRSLAATFHRSQSDKASTWRSSTPTPRSTDARRRKPTCNATSASRHPPSTRWCSRWSAPSSYTACPARRAASTSSSTPSRCRRCDDSHSIDQNHCGEVLGQCRSNCRERRVAVQGAGRHQAERQTARAAASRSCREVPGPEPDGVAGNAPLGTRPAGLIRPEHEVGTRNSPEVRFRNNAGASAS